MIRETAKRFEVWLNGRCFGKYRRKGMAERRLLQVLQSSAKSLSL